MSDTAEASVGPPGLEQNQAAWTVEYQALLAEDPGTPKAAAARYRHAEIKGALRQSTADKCMYCESRVTHIYTGDVEHIRPKSRAPELVVEWENLGFACALCNHSKGEYDDGAMPLVNPYRDDPTEHFRFAGALIYYLSDRGLITAHELDLNRPALLERRGERVKRVLALLHRWQQSDPGAVREILWEEVVQETDWKREFAGAAFDFLETWAEKASDSTPDLPKRPEGE